MGVWRGCSDMKANSKRQQLSQREKKMISLWFKDTYQDVLAACSYFGPWAVDGWTVTFPPKIEKRDPADFGRASFIEVGHSVKVRHMMHVF
jgi:hypothetical protein